MIIEIILLFMNFMMLMCCFYDVLIFLYFININKFCLENMFNVLIFFIKRCKGSFFLYWEIINSNWYLLNSSDLFIKISCIL